jgi:hypothetical protein
MNVLIYESLDKKVRRFQYIRREDILERLKVDDGLLEVIPMRNPNILVKPYFDIDDSNPETISLSDILKMLSLEFQCEESDWVVATAPREDKISYHIVSKKYKTTVSKLRDISKRLARKTSVIDDKCLYFAISDELESGYFRLPNQSKKTINKNSPVLKVLVGNIEDFVVTMVGDLILF